MAQAQNKFKFEPKVAGVVVNSFVDWPGKIAFVIFLGGCNFRCSYCHNYDILCATSNTIPFAEVLEQIKQQIGFIDGVVISGGEPTVHPYLLDIIDSVRALGLPVKLDTNGANFKMLENLVENGAVEYVAMDIKAPLEKYKEIAGVDVDVAEIEKSINFLKAQKDRAGFGHMFRTTPAPELTKNDLAQIKNLAGDSKYVMNTYREPD